MVTGRKPKKMQYKSREPIVENPRLGEMTEEQGRPRRIKGRIQLMPEDPDQPKKGTRGRMSPVRKSTKSRKSGKEFADQEEKKPVRGSAADRYVCVRVRVESDSVSVVGVRTVEGPLVVEEKLHAGIVFEVTYRGMRMAVGSVPDPAEMRSFAPPKHIKGQEGHFISKLPSYEFNIRLPQKELSVNRLPRIQVNVFRTEGRLPDKPLDGRPLRSQLRRNLRQVGQLKGIRMDELPPKVRKELRRAVR